MSERRALIWRVGEPVRVREALPFILVPVFFIVAALYMPGMDLAGRLLWIGFSGLILFLTVAFIRSERRKSSPL
jgi:hypothetical protein